MKTIYYFLFLLIIPFNAEAQDFKFGKVSMEELTEKSHPKEPDANAAILYREHRTRFDYNQDQGFFTYTEVFERVKIYSKEGFDWATQQVRLYQGSGSTKEEISGLKAYTYTLNSKGKIEETKLKGDGIFEEKKNKYVHLKKFTMPALTEGCVVEWKYKLKSPFISNIDTYRFQETIPVNAVSLRFEAPEYFSYKTHRRGWFPYKIDNDKYQRTMNYRYTRSNLETGSVVGNTIDQELKFFENIYIVDLKDVPALKKEAYAGNINNYAASLKFELSYTKFPQAPLNMYTTNWEAVSKSIYESNSFGDQLTKNGYFEKELDARLAGLVTQEDKMIAVFDFVKDKMNWNEIVGIYTDEGCKDSFKKGVGNVADINLILTRLFQYAGLDANPILLSTKANGIPIFPTRNGFNYVISGVLLDGQVSIFDATNKLGSPNVLDENLLNWKGRMVRKDGSSDWIDLIPSKLAMEAFMVNGAISAEGEVSGSIKSQYTGNKAMTKREDFQNLSNVDIELKLEKVFSNLDAFDAAVENMKDPYKPLKLDYAFETNANVEEIDGKLYMSPMLFLNLEENPFKQEERKYPIDYSYSKGERYIINLEVPDGYAIESLPESTSATVGNNDFVFKYLISEGDKKIQLMVDFKINTAFIPAENYKDIKSFYQYIIDKEKEKIVLTRI